MRDCEWGESLVAVTVGGVPAQTVFASHHVRHEFWQDIYEAGVVGIVSRPQGLGQDGFLGSALCAAFR
jgi:hypothetical protein